MRRFLLLWLLPALFGLSAVWLLRPMDGDAGAAPEDLTPAEWSASTAEAPLLQGHGRSGPAEGAAARGGLFGSVRDRTGPVAADVEVWRIAPATPAKAGAPILLSCWTAPKTGVPEPERVRRTRAGPDGIFRLEDLPPATYRVVACAATGAFGAATAVVRRGATSEAHVLVQPGTERLEGLVRWEDGRPWAGRVHVVRHCDRSWWAGPLPGDRPGVETDEKGGFVVTGLPRGTHRVHAIAADGLQVIDGNVWLPRDEPYELIVEENAEPLVGRVVSDDGARALPRALVRASCAGTIRTVATDWQGGFRIGWNGGWATLRVEAADHTAAEMRVRKPAPTDLVVVLSRNGGLAGRVVQDETDEPVGGIPVVTDKELSTTSEGDGAFSLRGVPVGEVAVAARGGGWVTVAGDGLPREGRVVEVLPGRSTSVVLRVRRAASVRGRVLGPDGVGIAGARVESWSEREDQEESWMPGRGSCRDPWPAKRSGSMPPLAAVTDAEGRFLLDALVPGLAYQVRAHAAGFAPARTTVNRTDPTGEELTLRLGRDRWIELRVIDAEGGAPTVAEVQIKAADDETTVAGGTPDEDGRLRLGPLPRTPLWVRVWSPRCISARTHIAPDERGPVEIRIHRARPVTGTVEYADGALARFVNVTIIGLDVSDRTEPDGSFRLWGVPAGTWVLRAGRQANQTRVTIRGGDTGVRVTLPGEGPEPTSPRSVARTTIQLRVRGPDGLPIPRATVQGGFSQTGTVRNGEAVVRARGKPLFVFDARSSSGAVLPCGPAFVGLPEDGADAIDVRLPPGEEVTGRVLDLDGRPISDAKVTAFVSADGQDCGGSLEGLSDGEGNFRIGGLGEGTVTLSVLPPSGYFAPVGTKVPAGSRGVIFRLRSAPRFVVTVLGPDGGALAGAPVHCVLQPAADAEGEPEWARWMHSVGGTTDASGQAPLDRLDPDRKYELRVAPPPRSPDLHARSLEDWVPADTTVSLGAGLVVDGRVVDLRGRPLPGFAVYAGTKAISKQGWSDRDGRFELGPFPRVELSLSASTSADRWSRVGAVVEERHSPTLVVPAGTRGVELRVATGVDVTVRIDDWDSYVTDTAHVAWLHEERTGTPDGEEEEKKAMGQAKAEVGEDGLVSFHHADPGKTYTFWLGPLEDERHAYRGRVRPGAREVHLRLEEGRTIRGRVIKSADGQRLSISACRGPVRVTGRVTRDGRYEIRGLPPGLWDVAVSARWRVGGTQMRTDAAGTVDAGGTLDLELGELGAR